MRRSLLAATLVALAAVLAGCSAISGSTSQATPPPAATTAAAPATTAAHAARAAAKATPDPSAACERRPASGDILLRMLVPTLGWQAQRLGGEWSWNATLRKCLTSAEMMIATAPTEAGNCTQVAYASTNPGYNPDATPAPPLKKVIAQAGPGC